MAWPSGRDTLALDKCMHSCRLKWFDLIHGSDSAQESLAGKSVLQDTPEYLVDKGRTDI